MKSRTQVTSSSYPEDFKEVFKQLKKAVVEKYNKGENDIIKHKKHE